MSNADLPDIRGPIITSLQQEWEICIIIPAQLVHTTIKLVKHVDNNQDTVKWESHNKKQHLL